MPGHQEALGAAWVLCLKRSLPHPLPSPSPAHSCSRGQWATAGRRPSQGRPQVPSSDPSNQIMDSAGEQDPGPGRSTLTSGVQGHTPACFLYCQATTAPALASLPSQLCVLWSGLAQLSPRPGTGALLPHGPALSPLPAPPHNDFIS